MSQPTDRNRIEELVQGYLDSALTVEAEGRLSAWLESDRAHVEYFAEQLDIHASLWETFMRVRRTSVVAPTPTRRPLRISMWASIAACLAIIAGSLAYNHWRSTRFTEVLVARIQATGPEVKIIRRGETIIAVLDIGIFVGDRIETGPGQNVGFAYEGEQTDVLIDENTILDIGDDVEGKRLKLGRGILDATVDRQPSDRPMVVTTPHAAAEVKGTRFRLFVGKAADSGSALGESADPGSELTRIDVFEGMVTFTRVSDGTWVDVEAGRHAIAGTGIELKALPIETVEGITEAEWQALFPGEPRQASEVRYVDGPVILKDDFEGGVGKWKVCRSDVPPSIQRYTEASAEERACVRHIRTERNGTSTKCVMIDVRGLENEKVMVGIRTDSIALPRAYAIEWTVRHGSRFAMHGTILPAAVREERALYAAPGSSRRCLESWCRERKELLPVRTRDGAFHYESRRYHRGRLLSRTLVRYGTESHSAGCVGLAIGENWIAVDDFVLRELVPEKSGDAGNRRE